MDGIRVMWLGVATAVVLGIGVGAQAKGDPAEEIWELEEAYWAAIAARDLDAYMEFWHESAAAYPVGEREVWAVDDLRQSMERLIEETDDGYLTYELQRLSVQAHGTTGVALYTVTGTRRGKAGRTREIAQRFLHTWHQSKGRWLLVGAMGSRLPRERTEDPRSVLKQARELAAEGQYEEALEKHVWFHERAVEIQPSLSGVRLSFALGDWLRLGESYPPALEALRSIRDEKTARIEGGEGGFDLFQDVAAINGVLGDDEATYALFKVVDEGYPDTAERAYIVARKLLVERRDYALCSKYVGDLRLELERLRESRETMLAFARQDPAEEDVRMVVMADEHFVAETAMLVEILAGTGRDEEVETVRAAALAVMDDDALRAALDAAVARASE